MNASNNSPVKFNQRKMNTELLMELGELAVGPEQVRRIRLSMSRHLQNVHVELFHAVVLLEANHLHNLQAAILLHPKDIKLNIFHILILRIRRKPTYIFAAQTTAALRSLPPA